MFYAHNILTKKGKLGIIWLAATYKGQKGKYLSSKDFKKVNITNACEYIINPSLPFALRLSSTLMVGVVRVHNEQTRIVLIEANEMMKAVKSAIAQQILTSELQLKQPEQRQDAITLPLLLDYEFDLPECQEHIHTDYLVTFARSDKYFNLPRVTSPEIRLPSPGSSPEQKISTEEEKSPYQADRKDITLPEIDFNAILEEEIKIPGEIDIVEPLPFEDIELREETGDEKTDEQGLSPLKAAEVPVEESGVMLFDERTGLLKPGTPTRESQIPHQAATPQQAVIERAVPQRPRRKRKLAIDFTIKLTGIAMRKNFNNVDTLKKRKICDIPRQPSLKDLFTSPATIVVNNNPHFRGLWDKNAKIRPQDYDERDWVLPEATYASPIIHEELSSGLDESPTSGIELLRGASHMSSEFEQSAAIDSTPEVSILERSRKSRDLSLSGDKKIDVSGIRTPSKPLSRLSAADRLSILSPIVDRDEDLIDLDVPLEDIEEHLSMEEVDQDKLSRDESYETLRMIQQALGHYSKVDLSSIIPLTTLRKQAAKIFYNVIALANMGVLYLVQDRPYEEIVIGRGRQY